MSISKSLLTVTLGLLITSINVQGSMENSYTIKLLVGQEIRAVQSFIAEQKLAAFREYPYLYEGTMETQNEFNKWFEQVLHSAVAVAYCEDNPVGFIAGANFVNYQEWDTHKGSAELFKTAGLKAESYYYISELIIAPEHRNNKLSKPLIEALKNYAQNLGYAAGCFITETHETHPLKPSTYRSLESLWKMLGCAKSSVSIKADWLTVQPDGSSKQQEHVLDYWLKDFNDSLSEGGSMRLYLSSMGFGDHPEKIALLVGNGKRVAVICNAVDYKDPEERSALIQHELDELAALGFIPQELDLRQYFGKSEKLKNVLSTSDFVWVRGGNTFLLRRAFKQSGLDILLPQLLANDRIAYGGYSAGVCILSPSLRGIDLVDSATDIAPGYDKEIVWQGLNIIDYAVAPHYKSGIYSTAMDGVVQYFIDNNIHFKPLKDGDVIIIDK